MRNVLLVGASGLLTAAIASGCGSPHAVEVTLATTSSFATTGGNLFNCSSPAQPATPRALTHTVQCEPAVVNGAFTTTPVTVTQSMGCGDGHAAIMTVTCAGTGTGNDVTVTVSVSIGSTCDAKNAATLDEHAFVFQDVAPADTQTTSLASCADFDNACTPTNVCEFNAFKADISVTNTLR
jgi:hypothetical protein